MNKRFIIVGFVLMEMCMVLGTLDYVYSDKNTGKETFPHKRKSVNFTSQTEKTVSEPKKTVINKNIKPVKPSKHTFIVDTDEDVKQYYATMKHLGVVIK